MSRRAPALLDRGQEIDRAAAALASGRTVTLIGPPGVGKTSLALALAQATDRPVCRGAALPFVSSRGREFVEAAVGGPLGDGDADDAAQRATALLDGAVIVLDDLHWADADGLDLLAPLGRRAPLIAVARTGESSHAVISALADIDTERIDLRGLQDDDALELVRAVRPSMPADASAELVARAGGNPLLLEELALRGSPTDSLVDFVDRQLSALDHTDVEDLYVLGASGGAGQPPPAAAARLSDRGLVTRDENGSIVVSGFVAERALDLLPPTRRRAVHARVAELSSTPAEAAMHWEAADDAQRAEAAATVALADGPPVAQRAKMLAVLARAARGDERFDRIVAAVPLLVRTNAVDEADELLQLGLQERDDATLPPRWLLFDAMVHQGRGEAGLALASLDEGLASVGDDRLARHYLHVVRAMVHLLRFDADGARVDLEALRTGLGSDPTGQLATTLLLMGGMDLMAGGEAWRGYLDQASREAASSDDIALELDVAMLLTYAHYFWGERAAGQKIASSAIARANEHGYVGRATHLTGTLAAHEYLAGTDPATTIETLTELVDDPAAAENREGHVTMLARALADTGRIAEGRQLVEHHLAGLTPETDVPWSSLHWALAEIELLDLNPARALEHARQATTHASGHPAGEAARAVASWCTYLLTESDDETCDPVATPHSAGGRAPALEALAVEQQAVAALTSGDVTAAQRLFEQAERATEYYFCPNRWRATWGRAEAKRRSGDTATSDQLLRDLVDVVRSEGRPAAVAWVRRDPTVVPDARTATSTGSDLTPRQTQILGLVNRGWTSRQISRLLGLAVSTVDDHVRAARTRLAARNRRVASRLTDAAATQVEPGPQVTPLIAVAEPSGLSAARDQLEAAGWECTGDERGADPRTAACLVVGTEREAELVMRRALDGLALALAVPDHQLAAILVDGLGRVRPVDDRRAGDPMEGIPRETLVLARLMASGAGVDGAAAAAALSRRTAYRRLTRATQVLGHSSVDATVQCIAERLASMGPPAP